MELYLFIVFETFQFSNDTSIMLNNIATVQVCDARKDDSSNAA